MCKAGGPRCSDRWGRARRALDAAKRSLKHAEAEGNARDVEAAKSRIETAEIRTRREVEASSEKLVDKASSVFGVSSDPTLTDLTNDTFRSREFSEDALKDITREEFVAIGSYTGSEFRKLNAVRRGRMEGLTFTEKDVVEIAQIDSTMKTAMDKHGKDMPCVAYRGMTLSRLNGSKKSSKTVVKDIFETFPVGSRVTDKGWMSTSADFWEASHIGKIPTKSDGDNKSSEVHCAFRVFGGRALAISAISAHAEEEEFIVAPNTDYTVIGHHHIDDGFGKRYVLIDLASDDFADQHLTEVEE